VTLKLEDGSTYPIQKGRLEFSDVTVDPTTGSVGLRATFANPNGVLLPGMYVRAVLGRAWPQRHADPAGRASAAIPRATPP
jgi:membrane fusion protein (multidrug efflux system)